MWEMAATCLMNSIRFKVEREGVCLQCFCDQFSLGRTSWPPLCCRICCGHHFDPEKLDTKCARTSGGPPTISVIQAPM